MKLPFICYDIIDTLTKKGYEAFVVGGSVRNHLLNLEISDFDVTTNARPEQVIEIFKDKYNIVETGLKHGTVTIFKHGKNQKGIEVTTYRSETVYSDNRHPDVVTFEDNYKDDASRRDFTINSLYYSPITNKIEDPFNGVEDIKNKVIRCIGNPDTRFQEDGLRILRAIRFMSVLDGFTIDQETKEAIFRNKDLLYKISKERIRDEFNKIIMSNDIRNIVHEYFDVFKIIVPQLEDCINYSQDSRQHKFDVLDHLLYSCQYAKPVLTLKLATFFHDIGKPAVMTKDEKSGRKKFHNHERASAMIVEKFMQDYHYETKQIRKVTTLVTFHDMNYNHKRRDHLLKLINRVGQYNILDLVEVKRADMIAHKGNFDCVKKFDERYNYIKHFLETAEVLAIKDLKFNGDDLKELGYKPGSIYSKILKKVFTKVFLEELPNDNEAIRQFVLSKFSLTSNHI